MRRREFLKLLAATTAILALPVIVAGQALHLEVEIDERRLRKAMKITLGKSQANVEIDQAKMWRAVTATDQYGRLWTTPDGKAWSCGADSFMVEG